MWDNGVLPGLIYLRSQRKTPYIAALVGTAEGGSHVLHHPLPLSFVFPHMDVISSNLSGFVKWQPDRETEELCFVARTWHSGTRCCGWQGMHWQTYWQPRKPPCCMFWALLFGFVKRYPLSPCLSCLLLLFTYRRVNHVAITLRGELEIWGLTLAVPTCYPTTVKYPKEGVWNWIEMGGGELKVHTDRLRKRKSKCSENKPQKLLQPLGNLLKAHKTKVCYNTWSYNGDPFHRFFFFFFFCRTFFFLFFSTGRGKLTRDWQPQVLQCMRPESNPTARLYSIDLAIGLTFFVKHWLIRYPSQPSRESHFVHLFTAQK